MTLDANAHHRHVTELALSSLVECMPSIDAAEVWQLDNSGNIRCTLGLVAGGDFYRPNQRVDGLFEDEDLEELRRKMEPEPTLGPVENEKATWSTGEGPKRRHQDTNLDDPKLRQQATNLDGPKMRHRATNLDAGYIRDGLVIRPSRSPGVVLGAPFCDYCFKVGRLWIGADRLARGFALVLRRDESNGQGLSTSNDNVAAGHSTSRSKSPRRKGGAQGAEQAAAAVGAVTTAAAGGRCRDGGNSGNIENGAFTARVAKEVGVALACVRGRERTAAARALALKRLSVTCSDSTVPGRDAQNEVLKEISSVLPGCRAYIGVLQSGGDALLYESATGNSRMRGRVLHRGEGVSFECLDDPNERIRVIHHRETPASMTTGAPQPRSIEAEAGIGECQLSKIVVGDAVKVWYASSWLAATVLRDRGHQCFDVRYDKFRETEAGVPRWRLQEVVILEHLNVKISWDSNKDFEDVRTRANIKDDAENVERKVKNKDYNDDAENAGRTVHDNNAEHAKQTMVNNNDAKTAEKMANGNVSDKDGVVNENSNKHELSWPWPFVCVPLRSGSNRVGVLGVDGWNGVQIGNPQGIHPEKAVFGFLEEAGGLLAAALYNERRNKALHIIGKTVRDKDATHISSLEALIVLLRETVTFRRRVDIFETRAAEPGVVYCLGTWESSEQHRQDFGYEKRNNREQNPVRVEKKTVRVENPAQVQNPIRVFGTGLAPRVTDLCITPAQLDRLTARRGGPPSPTKQRSLPVKEVTSYQREIHSIAKHGAGLANGMQATTVSTRPGEIVGRLQRLSVRSGGGRPSADGWYLVRVARDLPEPPSVKQSCSTQPVNKRSGTALQVKTASDSTEPGKGATATATTSGGSSTRTAGKSEDGDVSLLSELCRKLEVGFMAIASRQQRTQLREKALDRVLACCEGFPVVAEHGPTISPAISADGSAESPAAADRGYCKPPKASTTVDFENYKLPQGLPTIGPENNRRRLPFGTAAGAHVSGSLSVAEKRHSKTIYASSPAGAGAGARHATGVERDIIFSVPVQQPTAAETSDGRKGVLVSVKDGRLSVLVQQAEKSVAVVELPRGRQQILPEREVLIFVDRFACGYHRLKNVVTCVSCALTKPLI